MSTYLDYGELLNEGLDPETARSAHTGHYGRAMVDVDQLEDLLGLLRLEEDPDVPPC